MAKTNKHLTVDELFKKAFARQEKDKVPTEKKLDHATRVWRAPVAVKPTKPVRKSDKTWIIKRNDKRYTKRP